VFIIRKWIEIPYVSQSPEINRETFQYPANIFRIPVFSPCPTLIMAVL
jgi:hypothetical protein